jgi:hypothetical protein
MEEKVKVSFLSGVETKGGISLVPERRVDTLFLSTHIDLYILFWANGIRVHGTGPEVLYQQRDGV